MKKILTRIVKIIKLVLVFCISLWVYANLLDYLFLLFWNFDIFSYSSWQKLSNFWNAGGTFKNPKELSLLFSIIFAIPIWIVLCILLYKIKYIETIFKLFRYFNKEETNTEEERIVIKNIGIQNVSQEEAMLTKVKNEQIETHSANKLRNAFLKKISKTK